ncbi:MAG: mannose-1-phosphate guanyltransferase [bacterium]|nr:mannose-1-phosphate guanyltransferase [bacterium]
MKAVIMAGGFGTRLRPLTCNLPKPMVPMVNRPIMEHIIHLLKRHDITDILAVLYYHPEVIESYFGDGSKFGVKMKYVGAAEDLGTAGSVKNAEDHLRESFIIISGDVVTDFDLTAAIQFHKERQALATITLTRVTDPLSFGIVITEEQGKIVRFLEKPSWGEVFSDTVNTGIYILEPEVFKFIPKGKEFDFSRSLYPVLLEKKQPIYGYIAEGYWQDIGNLDAYRGTHYDCLKGEITLDIPGKKLDTIGRDVWVGEGSTVSKRAHLKGGVVIGKDCRIEDGATIIDSCLGDNVVVETGTNIINSIIWDRVEIGRQAELKEVVVASESKIKNKAFLGNGAIISEGCTVGVESNVRANVKMWPHKEIDDGATLSSSLIWGERWAKALFGTYGVTGLANIEITPEFAARLGAAWGASFPKGVSLMTARDNDKTCRMINRAIISGILSTGVNVRDISTVPIPVARYQVRSSNEQGGLHIRRAPYDPRLLEIRFFDAYGIDIPVSKEKAIQQFFFREDYRRARIEETGELSFPYRVVEYYKEGFMDCIDTESIAKSNFKIIIDYGFSDASTIFPSVLEELGCNVVALNAHTDPGRINRTQEDMARSLKQLSDIVVSLRADIGFMFDPEAERLFLVDEGGYILPNDLATAVVANLVSRCHPKATIAVPVNTTRIIEKVTRGKVKRTRTTPRAMMEETDSYMVSDGNGNFIFPQFQPAFDAMFASVKILEFISQLGVKLSELVKAIPPFYCFHERIPCSWERKGAIMRMLMDMTKDKEVELLDGVKVKEGNDWALFLPDPDRPVFHIHAESASIDKARELADRYAVQIKEHI